MVFDDYQMIYHLPRPSNINMMIIKQKPSSVTMMNINICFCLMAFYDSTFEDNSSSFDFCKLRGPEPTVLGGTPNFTLGFSHLLNLVNGDIVNGIIGI